MTGCVEADLERTKEMLLSIAKRPDCVALLGYDSWQVKHFIEGGIDRALIHYRKEANRKKKKANR